jgi:hypothetical protein
MTLHLIHSRLSPSDVLLNALCKAAHALVWAEDAATWHRNLNDAPDFDHSRTLALGRVERILRHAEKSHIISAQGVRRLMGVVFDAMVCSRWRVAGQPLPGFDTAAQIAALPKTLRQVWRVCRVQAVVTNTLRLAS